MGEPMGVSTTAYLLGHTAWKGFSIIEEGNLQASDALLRGLGESQQVQGNKGEAGLQFHARLTLSHRILQS